MSRGYYITPEALVKAWAQARTIGDVCRITGLQRRTIWAKARRLRKMGVVLPHFVDRRRSVDAERLNALMREGRANRPRILGEVEDG